MCFSGIAAEALRDRTAIWQSLWGIPCIAFSKNDPSPEFSETSNICERTLVDEYMCKISSYYHDKRMSFAEGPQAD